jgi:hypothetical protein
VVDGNGHLSDGNFVYEAQLFIGFGEGPDSEPSASEDFTVQIVDNDKCDHAFGPVTATSAGTVLSYSTVNAEVDSEVGSCGEASAGTAPGVWYQVVGTGLAITASTCSEDTTFDTQISVFQGVCGADNLVCVNGNNDFCGVQSSVVWPSQMGEIYHILVHGSNGSSGAFKLTISTDAERQENDFCASATEVVPGDSITFAFSGSTADPDELVCDGSGGGGIGGDVDTLFPYGIWYAVQGTGTQTVSVEVSFNTQSPVTMNIYTGSCGGLSCAEYEMSASCIGGGVQSSCYMEAAFETNPGGTYYIFVSTQLLSGIDLSHSLTIN